MTNAPARLCARLILALACVALTSPLGCSSDKNTEPESPDEVVQFTGSGSDRLPRTSFVPTARSREATGFFWSDDGTRSRQAGDEEITIRVTLVQGTEDVASVTVTGGGRLWTTDQGFPANVEVVPGYVVFGSTRVREQPGTENSELFLLGSLTLP